MAGRYPDYDWRGIAMLTQQLGQLFEPSKASLMSQQQKHEMNMLMAKKTWDIQTEQLDVLKLEYNNLVKDIATETRDLKELSLGELANAGMKDGAMVDQAAEVLEKTGYKKLSDMQDVANQYRDMIRDQKSNLSNMRLYNDTAKVGEKFGTDYKGAKGAKNYLEIHDIEPETPGFLSPDERENVKFDALNTMFLVEDVENLKEGTDYMTIHAAGKPVNVRPEALAFVAGFDTDSAEVRREKAEIAKAKYVKPDVKLQQQVDEWYNLDASFMSLPSEDRATINLAIEQGVAVTMLEARLRPTYKMKLAANDLAVKITKGAKGEENVLIQPLPDAVFEPEIQGMIPGFKDEIPKEWVNAGLSKDMYEQLRSDPKASVLRASFEHVIKNWDVLNKTEGFESMSLKEVQDLATKHIISQYNQFMEM